jgi:tRNA(Ile)-lysidine synthase
MLNRFKKRFENLKQKLLVSVSGGLDSMVLCDLLLKLNLDFSIAHVNYKLRGKESDFDENFVKNYANQKKINFYSISHDLSTYNKSIQAKAREIRYNYLHKLKDDNKFDYILTGHHFDDNIETVFLNLRRGKKNNSFLGIREKNNCFLRPLINFTKDDIKKYAIEYNLSWRDDSTNKENKYERNKIRNLIIPVINKVNTKYRTNFRDLFEIANLEFNIKNTYFDLELSKYFKENKSGELLSKKKFWKAFDLESFELEYFQRFGFFDKMELYKILRSDSGKSIRSDTYTVLSNRDDIIISKNYAELIDEFLLLDGSNDYPIKIDLVFSKNASKPTRKHICISQNIDKPLKLRRWKQGDFFYPNGMTGKKKLSKFFKDEKMSIFDKKNQWILSSFKDEILWIVGLRADRRNLVKNGKCIRVSI